MVPKKTTHFCVVMCGLKTTKQSHKKGLPSSPQYKQAHGLGCGVLLILYSRYLEWKLAGPIVFEVKAKDWPAPIEVLWKGPYF